MRNVTKREVLADLYLDFEVLNKMFFALATSEWKYLLGKKKIII